MPFIIGLTGGIASGKSTVSRHLTQLGAFIIDADLIAREVVARGSQGLEAIVEAFGEEMLDAHSELDRAKLGALIFQDSDARARLNQITHPRIAQRMMELAMEAERERGHAWVIYDAALLVENNIHAMLTALIVVSCEREVQLQRLMTRDGFSEEEARARIEAQLPLEEKVRVADHVIDNSGSLDHTLAQTSALYDELERRYGA